MSDLPEYHKPKVFLVDMPDTCREVLAHSSYTVATGSFGRPYRISRSNECSHVTLESTKLPNKEEQEIWVVNTRCPPASPCPPKNEPGEGVNTFWQQCHRGSIDGRPLAMHFVREDVDQIMRHGGFIILLADARYDITYARGSKHQYEGFRVDGDDQYSSWGFCELLDRLRTTEARGEEISWQKNELASLLSRAAKGAHFTCVFEPGYLGDPWKPLARNKFNQVVAALLTDDDGTPLTLVLPQMPNIHDVLVELLERWVCEWKPALFPHHEGKKWVHRPEYEVPAVLDLQRQVQKVEEEARQRVKDLVQKIDEIRSENQDCYTLLNGTGTELVEAVIRSLSKLGFKRVVDVDKQEKEKANGGTLREDLQILDDQIALIVDVKGVNGHPEDAEATQSEKHALMRSREFKGEVKPLTIINHQRNIPPHERDQKAYRDEIIQNAVQTELGLMTTWDLFKLLRNKELLGWRFEHIKPIFYRSGRIDPVPHHYRPLGKIAHTWEHSFGLVPLLPVSVGDRLAVESGDTFAEITVDSIRVDDEERNDADADSNCGIACNGASKSFKIDARIYLIEQDGEDHN